MQESLPVYVDELDALRDAIAHCGVHGGVRAIGFGVGEGAMNELDQKRLAARAIMAAAGIKGPRVDIFCRTPAMLAARELAARDRWMNSGVTAMRGAK